MLNFKTKKMKTQMVILNKVVAKLLLIVVLMVIAACSEKQKKSVKQDDNSSVSQTNIKTPDEDIHSAAFFGNLETIEQHIKADSDLNIKDEYGSTPLIIAATFGKTEVAYALINAGADINLKGNNGTTPLHVSAFFCRTKIVEALLKKGVDKSLRDIYGSTALESVKMPFADVKVIYDQISKELGPMGLKLDYNHLERTRPIIAKLLN